MTLLDEHPLPWEVAYSQKSSNWDEKSSPYIVDANGKIVVEYFFQHVCHPGMYDELADLTAQFIVNLVNAQAKYNL